MHARAYQNTIYNPVKAKMVENATDYKYSSAMYHAGLVNNSLVTDYDIGVLPSEYQDYLKSVIYNKRNTNVEISDIFLSEESIYPTDNYPFDNEKMNDSGKSNKLSLR
jgi:hypothetical protein